MRSRLDRREIQRLEIFSGRGWSVRFSEGRLEISNSSTLPATSGPFHHGTTLFFIHKSNINRVNNMALSPVPVKSSRRLPKSRNKRKRRSQKVVHINVCSITDDSSLSQIYDLVRREEYVPFPLLSGSIWC